MVDIRRLTRLILSMARRIFPDTDVATESTVLRLCNGRSR
jgi:hypothetical protein